MGRFQWLYREIMQRLIDSVANVDNVTKEDQTVALVLIARLSRRGVNVSLLCR